MTSDAAPGPDINPEMDVGPNLDRLLETVNIADDLDDELLDKIGDEVYRGYKRDLESKERWDHSIDEWTKLASQVKEEKTAPWKGAANVKYPLLSTAALQFQARAYPSLVPADGKIVQMKVVGIDQAGEKAAKADRLASHMNYQLKIDMPDWEEEMDRLLIQLPIVGCMFKKTCFDDIKRRNTSRLVGPRDLVVNYWATSLETAARVTEIIPMNKNQLQEKKNAKIYRDVELDDPQTPSIADRLPGVSGADAPGDADSSTPYIVLEQHTYWDFDDDGYAEPYVITIEERSKKVLRIVARWDSDGVIVDADKNVVSITPVEYYTKYSFIPNPDGGFYDIGFGHLLGPLNESANTIINQLLDAGHLSILQAGFLGRGLRLKLGEERFKPGEWKTINATGDDIKKQIFPLPVAPPNDVLFKLLGLVIESSDKLASIAEIFVGKMPGQNTPATTTQATIEQGMKVFTSIYKRVYRSLEKEFKKIFRLNSLYGENIERAAHILDAPLDPTDYDLKSYDVCPTADPTAASATQKIMKAQGLLELMPLGTLNVMEVTKRMLEAQEQANIESLMQEPQPQPDPKVMQAQAKMQMDGEKHQMDMAMKKFEAMMEQQKQMMEMRFDEQTRMMEMKLQEMENAMKMKHSTMQHNMKMEQSMQKLAQQRMANDERNQ